MWWGTQPGKPTAHYRCSEQEEHWKSTEEHWTTHELVPSALFLPEAGQTERAEQVKTDCQPGKTHTSPQPLAGHDLKLWVLTFSLEKCPIFQFTLPQNPHSALLLTLEATPETSPEAPVGQETLEGSRPVGVEEDDIMEGLGGRESGVAPNPRYWT